MPDMAALPLELWHTLRPYVRSLVSDRLRNQRAQCDFCVVCPLLTVCSQLLCGASSAALHARSFSPPTVLRVCLWSASFSLSLVPCLVRCSTQIGKEREVGRERDGGREREGGREGERESKSRRERESERRRERKGERVREGEIGRERGESSCCWGHGNALGPPSRLLTLSCTSRQAKKTTALPYLISTHSQHRCNEAN